METPHLKRHLYFRRLTKRQAPATEAVINILIAILIINCSALACSRNSLFNYLSEVSRMADREAFFETIKKLKAEGMIRIYGTQIYLTQDAKLYLYRLDEELDKNAFC